MGKKEIDYLFEDPMLSDQKFALVSIIGPNMQQKCDTWALKIRGVANTIEKAKKDTQRLINIDNTCDIYTVEVGKFFPLTVEPNDISDVEYQDNQLNNLMKTYLENREKANDEWHRRKNEMMQEAIKENKNKKEIGEKPEHPVAVLQKIKNLKDKLEKLKEELEETQSTLQLETEKFEKYSDEDKNKELVDAVSDFKSEELSTDKSVDDIRKELLSEFSIPVSTKLFNNDPWLDRE